LEVNSGLKVVADVIGVGSLAVLVNVASAQLRIVWRARNNLTKVFGLSEEHKTINKSFRVVWRTRNNLKKSF
jgi:uncharacterized protein YeaC (DUF1315 family)